MSAVFVTTFIAGLLLGVRVMLHGVERPAPPPDRAPHEVAGGHDPTTEPSPLLNAQNVAAFLVTFGGVGSALVRSSGLALGAAFAVALLAAAGAVALSTTLLAAWALPSARREVVDDRYLLQGHPATVTRSLGGEASAEGEITYESDGQQWTVPARSWDGVPIPSGEDVVIERFEGGVAYVEAWAQVETRL
jgi:membrane protein implicated in regulation of membrane protease activity